MKDWYIGIDNGVTGSIGILGPKGVQYFNQTPVKKELNYTKSKAWINRIDTAALGEIIKGFDPLPSSTLVLIERPMVNPGRFKATVSALRALEATLITIESLNLSVRYVDSKEWQQNILPEGLEGPEELKAASLSIGKRLFPTIAFAFKKDADSILMAEWARRNNL